METLYEILILVVVFGLYYLIKRKITEKKRRLERDGIIKEALVVKVIDTMLSTGDGMFEKRRYEFIVEVDSKKLSVYHGFEGTDTIPGPGDRVMILLDPNDNTNTEYLRTSLTSPL